MIYDLENDWMIPEVDETFTIWEPRSGRSAVLKCKEVEHEQACGECFFNQNKCRGCDINGTILLCLDAQRPDKKNVKFVMV